MRRSVFGITAFVFLAIAAASLSGCAKKPVETAGPPTLPVPVGHGLFLTNCAKCHQGPGNPPGPNAIILDSERLNTEESFRDLLRKPTSSAMPAFTDTDLSDGEIHEMYVYLSSSRSAQPH